MALGRSSDLSVDISGDASGFEKAVKSAEAATQRAQRAALNYDASLAKLGGDIARLEKQIEDDLTAALERQHQAMDKTGKGLMVFGAAVAAGLGLAGREAMRWESQWAGVEKTVDGSAQEMAHLEEQIRGLARSLPATHEEIAAVAEAAGQLGVQRDAIAGFTKTMIDLSETTNLTADEAATSIAQFMNVMRTAPDEVDNLGSALVALGNAGASTEADILAMAQRLSGAGALIGASEADVLALSSAMADLGIESQLGGGAASRALTKMYAAVKDGGPVLEGFADIAGSSATDFAAAFEADPIRAVDTFVQGLGRIQDSGGNVVAALKDVGISGTQDLSVLLRLSGAGDRLTQSLGRSSDAWAANNALQEEAALRYATTEARAQIAGNALRDNAIDIGAFVLPAMAAAADAVANLSTFFGDIPGPVKNTIVVLAAVAAAAALAGGAFLIAIPKVHAFNTAVNGLEAGGLKTAGTRLSKLGGLLMGPWGIALAAATAGVGLWAAKQGEAARKVDALSATLDEQTGALTENSQEWIYKELVQSGALDLADRVGLSAETVARAVRGEAEAVREVAAAYSDYLERKRAGSDSMGITSSELAAEGAAWASLQGKVLDTTTVVEDSLEADREKRKVLGALGGSTKDAAAATSALTGVTDRNTDGVIDNTDALMDNIDAMRDKRSEALRAANAQLAWEASLDDARKALKENGKTLDITTEKGRANRTALHGMAGAWNDLSDKAKNAPGAHRAAIESFVNMATKMGMGEDRARALAKRIMEIPSKRVKVEADVSQALSAVDATRAALDSLRDKRVIVTTEQQTIARAPRAIARADGGIVTGEGGPRDDKILARLSNGEFVVNAESTSKHRDLLEAINARRFAEGGFVGGKARQISGGFVLGQTSLIDPTPNLRAYNRAVRQQADALRDLKKEQREFVALRKAAREADRAARKDDTPANRKAAKDAARELEKAENQLARAKDRHAKATGRVKDAVDAYADAQAAAVDRAHSVATGARSGGTIFGSDFSDPVSVSQRIQATLARVRRFIGLRRKLVAAGVSPFLLEQLDSEGPSESAILFAEDLLRQPDLFRQLNRQSAALTTASNRLGADTAMVHGPRAGREVRYGNQTGQTVVVQIGAINAPQNMNPNQVGNAVAARVVAKLRGGG
jgi:TP901 family phage tail tape measure protein